jgi:PBP1b-binding outer membrane lipoprotein LpoB
MKSAIALATLALLVLTGCSHYRFGNISHPQLNSIAVGDVENSTRDPRLTHMARAKLPASFMSDGSLQLTSADRADCVLHSKVLGYEVNNIGEVRTESNDEDQQQYRTVMYGVSVDLEYALYPASQDRPILEPQTVRGTAEFARAGDLQLGMEDALERAMADAAGKVVAGVVEAW